MESTGLTSVGAPAPSFSYQCLAVQEMFLTGVPQYPVERTLLTSGTTDAAMESLYRGGVRIETPHLHVRYRASELPQYRPTAPTPQGASTLPFASDV